MTSIQDGKTFRDALQTIADQVELNLWLDRKVDPSSPVDAGTVGPTVAASISKLAESQGAVMMPVSGVVLVGRPGWVDATAATLLAIPSTTARTTVSWGKLSTPQQALVSATGNASTEVQPPLPHDLWPTVRWTAIDRHVATALVLAQFGKRAASFKSLDRLTTEPASSAGKFRRRYLAGKEIGNLRKLIKSNEPSATTRIDNGWLVTNASVATHRAVNDAMREEAAKAAKVDPRNDNRLFSLKPTEEFAGSLLMSFAKSAGLKCEIRPEAVEACRKIIKIEATDQTLKQLIGRVADEAGVVADWQTDKIVISVK